MKSPHSDPDTLRKIRPEHTFFEDPALDRALGVVFSLASEVYVLRDRLRAIETQLGQDGILNIEELNQEPSDEEKLATAADRDAFVKHVMHAMLGHQQSNGALV